LVRAVAAVADGTADGVISAGNTGALLSASLFLLKRIKGVRRPAIAAYIPTSYGGFIICDGGANVDVRPSDLVQFGLMGRSYSRRMFHKPTPRIGLINIGHEPGKGNEVTLQALPLLEQHLDNFVGSVEGRDLFKDATDVIVCDGFVGNILIKFGEGLVSHFGQWAVSKVKKHPISMLAAPLMKPALKDLRKDLDHEEYGGWPLLGVNGVSMVSHGSSSALAIRSAITAAAQCVEEGLIESIERGIKAHLDLYEETSANGST
jgi:glycerol-3-phosphate acyltransferase PlsX